MISVRLVQTQDRNLNQLQQNVKQAVEAPFMEDVGEFIGIVNGFTEGKSIPVTWQTGTTQNGVVLSFPGVGGTSNSIDLTVSGLPVNLWPQSTQFVLARVIDSGANAIGLLEINSDGTLVFFKDIDGNSFTIGGSKGLGSFTASYVRGI